MRQNLFFILIIIVSITFIARLFYLQIYDSKPYSIYEDNAIGKVYTYPKRGYIYDRNNKLLVSNQPSYDIMIIPGLVVDMDTTEFCELLKIDKNIFKNKFKKTSNYSKKNTLSVFSTHFERRLWFPCRKNKEIQRLLYPKKKSKRI